MIDENKLRNSEKISPHVGGFSENGMDLFALWNMLERRKAIVIAVAFATFIVIVTNAFLNTPVPVYKSTAHLSLPLVKDLEGIDGYTPDKAFRAFIKNLKSRAVRFRYFNENKLLDKLAPEQDSDAENVFEEKFNKMLFAVSEGNQVGVSFEGENSKLVAEWLNGFVMLANAETVHALVKHQISNWNSAQASRDNQINLLRTKIFDQRRIGKQNRENRIAKLEEAVLIAEYAGIKDIILAPNVILLSSQPLYMRGAKILRAEIKVLREHKNAVSPINNLQNQIDDLQYESNKSKTARSNLSHVSAMQVVQMATIPVSPINRPVFKWVMLTSVLSGLVLGLLAALFADFIARARENNQ